MKYLRKGRTFLLSAVLSDTVNLLKSFLSKRTFNVAQFLSKQKKIASHLKEPRWMATISRLKLLIWFEKVSRLFLKPRAPESEDEVLFYGYEGRPQVHRDVQNKSQDQVTWVRAAGAQHLVLAMKRPPTHIRIG